MVRAADVRVEVVYALPARQSLLALEVEEGCSVFEAARLSGMTGIYPEIQLETAAFGVFGKCIDNPRDALLREGDRVEIYRPLLIDPKVVRKQRAEKKQDG